MPGENQFYRSSPSGPAASQRVSRSERNKAECLEALSLGFNVAVVFRNKPQTFWNRPVIDGDLHDLRFLDPKGVIVGLSPKGAKAKADTSGFVI